MKILYKIFCLMFVLLFANNTFAQKSLELRLSGLNDNSKKLNFTLDSLNFVLENSVSLINAEKLKNNKDDEKISKLLANTASITNSIDQTQNDIYKTSELIENINSNLFNIYSHQIDSIKSNTISEKQKNVEIIKLTEKRLLVSPKIDMLSFSPQNVLSINVNGDATEQRIYKEYLLEAQQEVEMKILEINTLKQEVSNIIELNEETEDFLEEIDFDNNFAVYSNPTSTENLTAANDYNSFEEYRGKNNVETQSQTFSDILFQLGLSSNLTSDIQINSKNNSGSTNLHQFGNLISEVEKQLKDYQTVINNKLRTTSNK